MVEYTDTEIHHVFKGEKNLMFCGGVRIRSSAFHKGLRCILKNG